ncbi:MAG: transposase [Actinobacteria bacterium]|nr:transposase [Actinomycetota bacterium]
MPRLNLVKDFRPHAEYHVYNRGHAGRAVFRDAHDFDEFRRRLQTLLTIGRSDSGGRTSPFDLSLIAYALMDNHFHLLLRQGSNPLEIRRFMYALTPGYARYFKHRHGDSSDRPVWGGAYRARQVIGATDRMEVVAYIHLNRSGAERSEFTSHPVYLGDRAEPWVARDHGLRPFGGVAGYREFIASREQIRSARNAAHTFDR